MQLLIVHRDSEVGEPLVQMVKDYTKHDCDLVGSDAAATDWGRRHRKCVLLLTQLEAEGIDGLALGGSLSEIFPGLQILFFPTYAAPEQRLLVGYTKVFPEPIDGDGCSAQSSALKTRPPTHLICSTLSMFCKCVA